MSRPLTLNQIIFRLCYGNKTLGSTNSLEVTTTENIFEKNENKEDIEIAFVRNSSKRSSYFVISILVTFINSYIGNLIQSTFNIYLLLWNDYKSNKCWAEL